MVTLTIDNVEVTVERGTSILKAAQKAGIRIPTLCNDKRLIPYGACRLCMVEVTARGRTRKMPACFNPVRDGMEVATHTPRLIAERRIQLMLLLRTHPLQCPQCDAAGDCDLQNLVHEYQIDELAFARESRYFHVDNKSHFIRFNMNLCIKCGMCVRICDEVQGQHELSFVNRGMHSEISTDFGRPLDCEFCGQCASVCPVGAISSKWLVGTGREFELTKTDTICAYCSLGCTLTMGKKGDKVVYVTSPASSPNEGSLCVKGRYGWPYIYSGERLQKPLIRKDGTLQQVEWNEALDFTARELAKIKQQSGGASIAALGSARLTNEEAYVFNRFSRTVLGTPHLDHGGGYAYRGLVDGLAPSLGYPASTNSIREIRKADVVLLLAADLTETHPIAKNEVVIATGPYTKSEAIVVDSVQTKLCDRRGMKLFTKPGMEHVVAYGMLKHIIDAGLFDRKAVDLRCDGFDALAASLEAYTPEAVAAATGVDVEVLRSAAAKYAQAPSAAIVISEGTSRPGYTAELAKAAANLALITGHIGKVASGVYVLGEKANSQGAIDMGLLPGGLPGFRTVGDEDAVKQVESAWGSPIAREEGLGTPGIFAAAEGKTIRGLYVVGENPVDTFPNRALAEKALGSLDFLVVQDLFLTSTAKMAHVVLPVATFAEKAGTFTSADRRVQKLRPVLKRGAAKTDLEVFLALAALMGAPSMTYSGLEQILDEIAGLVPVYKGVSSERLGGGGVPWPCQDEEDPGNEILYAGDHPHGKAMLVAAPPLPRETQADGFPLFLIPSALKFHSGSMSAWSASLMDVCPEGVAEMNRKDMRAMGLSDGDSIRLTNPTGASVQAKVKRSRRPLPGSVIVPYHFPAIGLNRLMSLEQPAIKVKVEKV
ncbi:MAG: molybdopterin-dependent oxidoreductase [Thermodesulfobacteriota bacterium]